MMQAGKIVFYALFTLALAACGGGGAGDAVTSGAATEVAATVPPSISTQPIDQTVLVGTSTVLSVAVGGDRLNYQWQRSADAGVTWINLSGANASSYTLVADSSMNGIRYRVLVSNSLGNVFSSPVTINVVAVAVAPTIAANVAAQSVVEGGNAVFAITATGAMLNYQWQTSADGVSWANIGSATASTLRLSNVTSGDNGKRFRVVINNSAGSVTSASATLTVSPATAMPTVLTAPVAISVKAPAAATFNVIASGTPAPIFQWQSSRNAGANYADIAGATGSSYTTPATTLADGGSLYRVRISNSVGTVLSNSAALTVTPADVAPALTTQPAAAAVTEPSVATFNVAATGSPSPAYQWQSSTDGIVWININAANAASYTTPATSTTDSGKRLRVVVSNGAGSITSSAAILTVNAPAASSVLSGRTWTAGKLVDAYNGRSAELALVAIDDSGAATVIVQKSNGTRKVLSASRGSPGAAGIQPTWTTPIAIDGAGASIYAFGPQLLYDPWYGVTTAPNGDVYVVWTTSRPCTANSAYTNGDCVYLVLAQYSSATAAWLPPVIVAENFGNYYQSAAPVFKANAAGDFAMRFSSFERLSTGAVKRDALVWRKRGTSSFVLKTLPTSSTSFDMDANGNLVVFGEAAQNATIDYVAYRGNVTAGLGAQEVLDTRFSAVRAELHAAVSPGGQIFGFYSQYDGTDTRLYSVTAPSISSPFTVTALNSQPPSVTFEVGVVSTLDSGDALLRQGCSSRRWSAMSRTWSAAIAMAGNCVNPGAVSPKGDALSVDPLYGRWATYDALGNRMIQSFPSSNATTGPSFVLGVSSPIAVGFLPKWSYALSSSGVGVLVVLTTLDVLPTPAAPNGDGRVEVYNVWGLFLK